jgi:hypothetical protein
VGVHLIFVEVQLECMDFGVYPSVDGWHGGCWDVTVWEPNKLEVEIVAFISSFANNAALEVYYSNLKAYKWVLHHTIEGERISDETGQIFFNWFGRRSKKVFSNGDV